MNKILIIFLFSVSIPLLLSNQEVFAANLLVVDDDIGDSVNIEAALQAGGHTVTTVTDDFDDFDGSNPTLAGVISQYDAIFWTASGEGGGARHEDPATFTNLMSYVNNGGCVFVTGYDSVASPSDPLLVAFLGADDSEDNSSSEPEAIENIANALTVGVRDIRGVVPLGGSGDQDNLLEPLASDTTGIARSDDDNDVWSWTLREPVGPTTGKIAYVSNGESDDTEETNWLITSNDGLGAYNAALLNFAFACEPLTVVGGEFLSIDSTALLLAGAQSFSWMIPILLSGIGIGLFVVSRKSE